jgi:hypothetical protein
VSGFTPDPLAALERPQKPVRVGKARKGSPCERTVQREIVKALRRLRFRVWHIPNGGSLAGNEQQRIRQGVARRMDGVVSGAPDLMILRPAGHNSPAMVGFLEVKREGGKLAPAQLACLAHLEADGFDCAAVCTVDGALEALREWGWL